MRTVHYVVGRQVGKTTKMLEMIRSSRADVNFIITYNSNSARLIKSLTSRGSDSGVFKNVKILRYGEHDICDKISIECSKLDKNVPQKERSVNIYIDELLSCVELKNNKSKYNITTDLIDYIDRRFDSIHSNIVAFSTPFRKYSLDNYTRWINGEDTLENYFFEQGLLSSKYVSDSIPNNRANEKDVLDRKLKNGLGYMSAEHVLTRVLGKFL